MAQSCLLICSNFLREVTAVLKAGNYELQVATFDAGCIRPMSGRDPAAHAVARLAAQGHDVIALGSYCLRGAAHQTLAPGAGGRVALIAFDQCFELVADPQIIAAQDAAAAYLLTPGWLRNWPRYMRAWGFDRPTARTFFGETVRQLVLLDTGVDDQSAARLDALAAFLALPRTIVPVGLGRLQDHLIGAIESKHRGTVFHRTHP